MLRSQYEPRSVWIAGKQTLLDNKALQELPDQAIAALCNHLDLHEKPMTQSNSEKNLTDAAQCANYLKAIGDPVRLQVVRALQTGPLSVSDIAELLEIDISNASHHLRVLYHADIVLAEKDGKFTYYKLNSQVLQNRSAKQIFDFGCCKLDLRD